MKLTILILILTACGPGPSSLLITQTTAPWIVKGKVVYPGKEEQTPILWTDNKEYDIVDNRNAEAGDFGTGFYVYDENHDIVASVPFQYGFPCAIVSNGTLYVFGADNSVEGNSIAFTASTDLIHWSQPQVVLTAPNDTIFYNTSITADPTGFTMVSERTETGQVEFTARFYHSTDLMNWVEVGGAIIPDFSTCCPMVRYVNGYYYVTYLSFKTTFFSTAMARSKDLVTWEYAKQVVLAPDMNGDEGISNSDMDMMVQTDGTVKILYIIGFQTPAPGHYISVKTAYFNGTEQEFFERFF